MDCDYCKTNSITVLESYETNEGSIRELEIVFNAYIKKLYVRTKTEDQYDFTFGADKRFVFCPMCGRKL